MRRIIAILAFIAITAVAYAFWANHCKNVHAARLSEYPSSARAIVNRVLLASGAIRQQEALLACPSGLSSLSAPERADVYITLLRHRMFDASAATSFIHIALLDRQAFNDRAAIYERSSSFASLPENHRKYLANIFSIVRSAIHDD